MNNDIIIKGKIDANLNDAFKKVLSKLNMTQQDFIDKSVKEFVLNHLHLILSEESK